MKHLNIENYLDGRMSGAELEAFEKEMRNNPAFAKLTQRMSQVKEDLEMQSLREDVKKILHSDGNGSGNNRNPSPWWGLLAGIVLLCLAGYFFTSDKEKEETPSLIPRQEQEQTPTEEVLEKAPTPEKKKTPETNRKKEDIKPVTKPPETKKSRPMAKNNTTVKLPPPLYPSPNVRGQNDSNKEWKAMLDKLWYTDFPPINALAPYSEAADLIKERNFKKAFVKLELLEMKSNVNDTLRLLKGYCLLEMGEGGDALRYFEQIEKPASNWQGYLQWHRALGTLCAKGIADAIPLFKEIRTNKDHPFNLQSEKALEVLE